jgi:Ser/Thr protein kinase RdoA (MazF antagonist)
MEALPDKSLLERVNRKIADRTDVFYWQTDRAITPQEAETIWADRHSYFSDQDIVQAVNAELSEDKLDQLEPLDRNSQTSLGNINSVRVGSLASGKAVVIRCHPRGVQNGYFYAEAAAAKQALDAGLPAYRTLAIHELNNEDDFSFQVCEKLAGTSMAFWLRDHPDDEAKLTHDIGVKMARLHQIQVDGFGPFDNTKAKQDQLAGLHSSYGKFVRSGLAFNLSELVKRAILNDTQAKAVDKLLREDHPLLSCRQAVLIHNDMADWNVVTDGTEITGLLDWDECVGGDPVTDIACWSTFFDPSRLEGMLKGYWTVAQKPADFDEKFELLRLRYVISKMTLRTRRAEWDPSETVREKIEFGKLHLKTSLAHFDIG